MGMVVVESTWEGIGSACPREQGPQGPLVQWASCLSFQVGWEGRQLGSAAGRGAGGTGVPGRVAEVF